MTTQKQDTPKVIALVGAIVAVFVFIIYTALNATRDAGTQPPPAESVASLDLTKTLNAANSTDPMAYVKTIERYSAPPPPPVADPFRGVLPRSSSGGGTPPPVGPGTRVPNPINGMPLDVGVPPFSPSGSGVQAGTFPDIKVEGVLVDYSRGDASTYAVLEIDRKQMYVKTGDKLQPDLKIVKITESGIWIQAAKERAFIEVSKTYRPTGLPTPGA